MDKHKQSGVEIAEPTRRLAVTVSHKCGHSREVENAVRFSSGAK